MNGKELKVYKISSGCATKKGKNLSPVRQMFYVKNNKLAC